MIDGCSPEVLLSRVGRTGLHLTVTSAGSASNSVSAVSEEYEVDDPFDEDEDEEHLRLELREDTAVAMGPGIPEFLTRPVCAPFPFPSEGDAIALFCCCLLLEFLGLLGRGRS